MTECNRTSEPRCYCGRYEIGSRDGHREDTCWPDVVGSTAGAHAQPSSNEQLKPFLEWIRGICVDESRTHYRRIQAILAVIHHYQKRDEDETAAAPDCSREGHEWRKGRCAVCGMDQGNL